jgi:hypothetical protein
MYPSLGSTLLFARTNVHVHVGLPRPELDIHSTDCSSRVRVGVNISSAKNLYHRDAQSASSIGNKLLPGNFGMVPNRSQATEEP